MDTNPRDQLITAAALLTLLISGCGDNEPSQARTVTPNPPETEADTGDEAEDTEADEEERSEDDEDQEDETQVPDVDELTADLSVEGLSADEVMEEFVMISTTFDAAQDASQDDAVERAEPLMTPNGAEGLGPIENPMTTPLWFEMQEKNGISLPWIEDSESIQQTDDGQWMHNVEVCWLWLVEDDEAEDESDLVYDYDGPRYYELFSEPYEDGNAIDRWRYRDPDQFVETDEDPCNPDEAENVPNH